MSGATLTNDNVTNLEELAVVWVDENSQNLQVRARLRCIINFLKVFTSIDSCLNFIKSVPNEKFFVIVSGQLSSQLIPVIQDLPQVMKVYIFCQNVDKYVLSKSSGIFCDEESLYKQLAIDVNNFYAAYSIPISCISEKGVRDLTKEIGSFFWFRLFISALLEMPPSNSGKHDFLTLAREFYGYNEIELNRIDDFERNYDGTQAVTWYSKDSFVYRILNKAIRTENIDLLFSCRFFIRDLHKQLESLQTQFIQRARLNATDILTVYRGQPMATANIKRLLDNIGKFISIDSFLSTTVAIDVAMVYTGDALAHSDMRSVLFQITVDTRTIIGPKSHPFADISAYSQFVDEQEILFSLGAMFRIEDITERSDHIWLVKLTFIDNTEEMNEMHRLSKYLGIDSNLGDLTKMTTPAQILFYMSEYSRAISLCRRLMNEISDDLSLTISSLNIMGLSYRNEPKLALESFEKALELQLQYDPNDYSSLVTIYNNLGFTHRRLSSKKEIIMGYYEKAFHMCISNPNQNNIDWCLAATCLNNIVTADPTGDSDLALKREQIVLSIRLKFLPMSHPVVADTHTTLAGIYTSRSQFDLALEHYAQAMQIKMKYLPNEHTSVAGTQAEIALLYLDKGDYEKTRKQEKEANESYEKSLSLNDGVLSMISSLKLSLETDYQLLSLVLNNMGVVYYRLGRYDEALSCFYKHDLMLGKILPANNYNHGAILKNKGCAYMLKGEMDKSMQFYLDALKFFRRINLSKAFVIAQLYFYIGEWYEKMHQMHRAVAYYEHAADLASISLRPGHPTSTHYLNTFIVKKSELLTIDPLGDVSWL